MIDALRHHWQEYLMEAALLGIFMISACTFGVLLGHPASPIVRMIDSPWRLRALMGIAMGATAAGLIYSPWGKRSGAHFNPSVTLTFLRMGKIAPFDALFYVVAQFAGGVAGVLVAALALGRRLADPSVNYVATLPGPAGPRAAFLAETAISFVLMVVVLGVSNARRAARFTGLCCAALVASCIAFESPISGMSMNPARTFGSALPAGAWGGLWIYFTAPPFGMFLAAQAYLALRGARAVHCAKLHHAGDQRCIFRCGYAMAAMETV